MESVKTTRLTRKQWLADSLEILAREGLAGLSLNNLIGHFQVTKGSFYWHFESQADFHAALVDHWHEVHTVEVRRRVDAFSKDGAEKLERLMGIVIGENHGGYDSVIHTLGAQNAELMPKVAASYRFRAEFVRSCFADIGFRGDELVTRTRVFVAFMAGEPLANAGLTTEERLAQIPLNCAIFVPKRSGPSERSSRH
jgi:AcrR family transcriptional regulator